MNTPTHFLMTVAARKALPSWNIPWLAVAVGSVAPDIPLYVLTFGGLVYFTQILGWTARDAARRMFDTLYFRDPIWIGLHNVLHSPLSLGVLLVACFAVRNRWPRQAIWMTWFLLACLLHSVVDIFTHNDDGPLLLWPLNWKLRFESPVSYWDHRYFGREMATFELTLVIGLIGYLMIPWAYRRLLTGKPPEP